MPSTIETPNIKIQLNTIEEAIADIRAVGPNVWNAWKGQLLGDLYHNTEAALRGGRTDEHSVTAELKARAETNRELVVDQIGALPKIMLEMDEAYWTGFDTPAHLRHAGIVADYRKIS